MTTYVYETTEVKSGQKPRYFEFKQSMKDAPLTHHPETGEPIRRVVLGGFGILKSSGAAKAETARGGSCCCGPGECCP
jgi:predicted nucleic acid-binding Zn ribbon protein